MSSEVDVNTKVANHLKGWTWTPTSTTSDRGGSPAILTGWNEDPARSARAMRRGHAPGHPRGMMPRRCIHATLLSWRPSTSLSLPGNPVPRARAQMAFTLRSTSSWCRSGCRVPAPGPLREIEAGPPGRSRAFLPAVSAP
jgi:hypothetical protein